MVDNGVDRHSVCDFLLAYHGTMVLSYTVFELFGVQNIIPPLLITVSRNNRLSYLDSTDVVSVVP